MHKISIIIAAVIALGGCGGAGTDLQAQSMAPLAQSSPASQDKPASETEEPAGK